MARTTPQVIDDLLIGRDGQAPIVVGSADWFAWLEQATTFALRCPSGSFTARREPRARGDAYWRAYRTVAGRQRRAYLGRSADLTAERLHAVAAQLAAESAAPPATPEFASATRENTSPASFAPLLATKLYVPQPRVAAIHRAQLLDRLDAGLNGTLTLIAAPAGFGKTTLLAEWLGARVEGRGMRTEINTLSPQSSSLSPSAAWLALDTGDNDPTTFLRYLIAALQRAAPIPIGAIALALLDAPQAPPLTTVLTALINDLAAVQQRMVLVLDDYHVISAPAVHSALGFLVDHAPPSLHLVIASREDPPLPLARMRARGQVNELRAADLRFSQAEAAAFLHEVMQIELGADEVAALDARTEGWAAGLQLAALALHQHPDRAGFIANFAGSNRFVVDYLAAEVLDRLPAQLHDFLLRTSILDRLCGPLCDAVLGKDESSIDRGEVAKPFIQHPSSFILEQLEHLNLFLLPLDAERHWYRYHQLFAGVLRERLGRSAPATAIAELHRRASAWFERQELIAEAIDQALLAGDAERAADLIAPLALAFGLEGQHVTVAGWLSRLPATLLSSRPRLLLAQAHIASFNTDYAAAEALLKQIDDLRAASDAGIGGEVAALRALGASMLGDARAIELGRAALARLPAQHPLHSATAAALGYAYFYVGDLAATDELIQPTLAQYPRASQSSVVYLGLVALLAMVRRAQGRLNDTIQLSADVLRRATRDGRVLPVPGVFLAYLLLGLTECERDELDAAERTIRQCARLATEYGITTYEILTQFYLAQVIAARGDLDAALALVERAEAAAANYLPPSNAREFAAYRVLIWLRQGRIAEAGAWAESYDQSAQTPNFTAYDYDRFALAETMIAQQRWDAAQALVIASLHDASATGHGRFVIWALVLQASIAQQQGDSQSALAAIDQALALAEPEGYVRAFVDGGPPIAALLRTVVARGSTPGYAERLLARAEGRGPRIVAPATPSSALGPQSSSLAALAEPLSPRELEVLRLLAAGHDNAEIARRLVVAVSTVKSHINHAFGKLGARNRLEAVLRAQELRLL